MKELEKEEVGGTDREEETGCRERGVCKKHTYKTLPSPLMFLAFSPGRINIKNICFSTHHQESFRAYEWEI